MKIVNIFEEKLPDKIEQCKLPFSEGALGRKMSKRTVELHYGTLHKNYVKNFNTKEGHNDWNYAGAYLHNIWWSQLSNKTLDPGPKFLAFVKDNFGSLASFKKQFEEECLSLHGNGWCYLSNSGSIKLIPNHETKNDILLLLDLWEHAYIFDFGANKKEYINTFWTLVNWVALEDRLK